MVLHISVVAFITPYTEQRGAEELPSSLFTPVLWRFSIRGPERLIQRLPPLSLGFIREHEIKLARL